MGEFFRNLPDGWTIYVWLVVAAMILIAAGFMLRWAAKNEQFDEDIKYVVFDADDKDKMTPEEFEKFQEVEKEQTEARQRVLKERAEEKAKKHAKG
jgi:nitrogen fixation-related uncharacterized protein